MVNIKPLLGPEAPRPTLKKEKVGLKEISPNELSTSNSGGNYVEKKDLPTETKSLKKVLQNFLKRLNII